MARKGNFGEAEFSLLLVKLNAFGLATFKKGDEPLVMVFNGFYFSFTDSVDQDVIKDRHKSLKSCQGSVEASLELFRCRGNIEWHSVPTVSAPWGSKVCQEAAVSIQLDMPKSILGIYCAEDLCL